MESKELELNDYDDTPKKKKKRQDLQKKLGQKVEELKIVDWYIEIFEDGLDTRDIVKHYNKLKKDHASLVIE